MVRHHTPVDAIAKEALLDEYVERIIKLVGEKAVILLDCSQIQAAVSAQISIHTNWKPHLEQIALWHQEYQAKAQAQGTRLDDITYLDRPPMHYNTTDQYF
jgi:hypothetical protein